MENINEINLSFRGLNKKKCQKRRCAEDLHTMRWIRRNTFSLNKCEFSLWWQKAAAWLFSFPSHLIHCSWLYVKTVAISSSKKPSRTYFLSIFKIILGFWSKNSPVPIFWNYWSDIEQKYWDPTMLLTCRLVEVCGSWSCRLEHTCCRGRTWDPENTGSPPGARIGELPNLLPPEKTYKR